MNKICLIIPLLGNVQKYNDKLEDAITNLDDNITILISYVTTKENEMFLQSISDKYKATKTIKLQGIEDNDGIKLLDLIQEGINNCDEDWVSFLKIDDKITEIWFKNVMDYINKTDYDVFLPLTNVYKNFGDNFEFSGFENEAPLASAFSNELGFVDLESLESYYIYNLYGAVFSIPMLKSIGGIKTSMKEGYWLELMMRILYNKYSIYVIPKVGYNKYVIPSDSNMSEDEYKWWINLARKEYFYKEDRNIKYTK